MDIRVLINYPADEEVAYTPDDDEIIAEHLRFNQIEEQEDDTEALPRVMSSQALNATQTLENVWLQQPDLIQDFLISLQRMKDQIGKIRSNQLVQKPI
uniref:EKC/KEOPS complex subunit GON7 n=1 Tax=Peronospora matthiolae TaxID=2874970 RepID=A0AAV1V1R0_9STRA